MAGIQSLIISFIGFACFASRFQATSHIIPGPEHQCRDDDASWSQAQKAHCPDNLRVQRKCPVTCRLCADRPRHQPGRTQSPAHPRQIQTTTEPRNRRCPTDPAWCSAHRDACQRPRLRQECPKTCEMCKSLSTRPHTQPPPPDHRRAAGATTNQQPTTGQYECRDYQNWCRERKHECAVDPLVWSMCPKICGVCLDYSPSTPKSASTSSPHQTTRHSETKPTARSGDTTQMKTMPTSETTLMSTTHSDLSNTTASKIIPITSTSSNIISDTDANTPTMSETTPTAQGVFGSATDSTSYPVLDIQATAATPYQTIVKRLCHQCGSDGAPCSLLDLVTGQPSLCSPGLDFCFTHVTQMNGARSIVKSCVDRQTCQRKWYEESSDRSECVMFDLRDNTLDLDCNFCCQKDNCNRDLKPVDQSLYDPSTN